MKVRIRSALKPALWALFLAGASLQAQAQTRVEDPWVRATVPGQPATGAFMHITSTTDSKLVGVSSPVAKSVQIHQSSMKNDVMSMQRVDSVDLPAARTVVFDANGYHVMFMGLAAQIKEGDQVPLTLTVENDQGVRESIEVSAPARALTASEHDHDHAAHGEHSGH